MRFAAAPLRRPRPLRPQPLALSLVLQSLLQVRSRQTQSLRQVRRAFRLRLSPLSANGAPVTINSVEVVRQGPSVDTDIAGVELINASTGIQLGISHILDANHTAAIGNPITIPAGTSVTFWVAANVAAAGSVNSGDIASFAVTAVNTASTVSGSLPITGASNTFNNTALIGSATIYTSSYDPNSASSQPIGTTGYRFSAIRIQAGSQENLSFKSITWYQSGSASGLANVVTVVNGTSYPTTLDSTGRYYTTVFPIPIVIQEGQSVDVYVQGDLECKRNGQHLRRVRHLPKHRHLPCRQHLWLRHNADHRRWYCELQQHLFATRRSSSPVRTRLRRSRARRLRSPRVRSRPSRMQHLLVRRTLRLTSPISLSADSRRISPVRLSRCSHSSCTSRSSTTALSAHERLACQPERPSYFWSVQRGLCF